MNTKTRTSGPSVRRVMEGVGFVAAAIVCAAAGVMVKEGAAPRAMMVVDERSGVLASPGEPLPEPGPIATESLDDPLEAAEVPGTPEVTPSPETRWFNARPVVPVKKIWMRVTAYSPDARSCGESADGLTATLHHVSTNDGKLAAADTRILPFGSMISVPGYDEGMIVPVLDCGGAIKGHRLDVLFPTHEAALKWGVRHVQVTVWGYADGLPAENPRAVR